MITTQQDLAERAAARASDPRNAKRLAWDRMEAGARRYAAADRTDPFVYARALAHMKVGVATVIRRYSSLDDNLDKAVTSYYNADPYVYERTVVGVDDPVPTTGYRSLVRP